MSHRLTDWLMEAILSTVHPPFRPSVLDTVKPNNNKYSRFKEENPALLE